MTQTMNVFKLTKVEQGRAQRFLNRHRAHSVNIIYSFTVPIAGEGVSIKVRCDRCNKSENITEFK